MGITHKTDGKSGDRAATRSSNASGNSTSSQFHSASSNRTNSSETISEKFTQKADNDDDKYTAHDTTDTFDHRKIYVAPNFYFYVGFTAIFLAWIFYSQMSSNSIVEYERDRTLQEQAAQRAEAALIASQHQQQMEYTRRASAEVEQNNAILRNSTDLLRDSSSRSL